MKTFTIPTAATVSAANHAIFAQLQKGLGMVPNLYATLAHSEHPLGDYLTFVPFVYPAFMLDRRTVRFVQQSLNGK